MIDRTALLSDLQKLLKRLEADLLERSESADVPDVGRTLRAEFERAKAAERTAQNFEDWRSDAITQAAAAWVLSCVFERFLEDNRLAEPPKISGPSERLQRARDEHELYFREHPKQTDRDYLLAVFDQLATLPGTKHVFGEHNPIRELPNWLSGDAAEELLRFFQKIDANTGILVHDFTDVSWDTRFLGDLYQDLSEAARKKYALLQTPEFVEEFILDRTLNPALDEFGLDAAPVLDKDGKPLTEVGFRMIDPACGSGHFLLGAFPRILDRWQRKEPGTNVRKLVQRTLDSVFGVDVNPYAVAIARFRLLLAAMRACNVTRLADAPAFRLNLACGDSLLHAPLRSGQQVLDFELTSGDAECEHAYQSEDLSVLKRVLRGGQYHAVVANPPYIVPKDKQLNERYRKRFRTCHLKYSLTVPFMERIFHLAVGHGFTGQITATSFMKRQFGKKLVENFFPTVDLTHVIDTRGVVFGNAGFGGTSTAILFGRHRTPVGNSIRTVMGLRGEPGIPRSPSEGVVWASLIQQIDCPNSDSEFICVRDFPRERFLKHPWSIGGGGAAETKEQIEEQAKTLLSNEADVGVAVVTLEDEAYQLDSATARRALIPFKFLRGFVIGDTIRDWTLSGVELAIFPHLSNSFEPDATTSILQRLWPLRTGLGNRLWFRKTMFQRGMKWFEYGHISIEKFRTQLSIVFSFLATHNNFVLDPGGKVFKQSAPVVKLSCDATERDHHGLLGVLNSSTACFWMKQVFHSHGAGGGTRVKAGKSPLGDDNWESHYEYDSTKLKSLPLTTSRPVETTSTIIQCAAVADSSLPSSVLEAFFSDSGAQESRLGQCLRDAATTHSLGLRKMISLQEELDWECYRLYGLIEDDLTLREPPPLKLGQRAFEIVLARKVAAGDKQTTWFERHRSTPMTELPVEWPDDYRQLVQRRIDLIESNPNIRLIEQPEYKRRWNTEPWDSQLERALREWLLDRLERYFDFDGRMNDAGRPTAKLGIALVSVAKLADVARQDPELQQVGELYRDDPAFDLQSLVNELVSAESVPLLPVLRYKPSGLIKRGTWERTWELQRREDALSDQLSAISDQLKTTSDANTKVRLEAEREKLTADRCSLTASIPVPTKYDSKDFLDSNFWRLRGKLDVPKERWISFPHCEGADGTLVICWAGYDHLQQARAISAYYVDIQERLGGRDDPRLIPLLACLLELLPWLKQWHNEVDPEYGMAMGDYFEGFVNEEARQLGKTILEIKAWTPPARTGNRGRRRSKT